MPHFAGKGVHAGLKEVCFLSEKLTGGGKNETIEAAIADYERKMVLCASSAQLERSKIGNTDASIRCFISRDLPIN